MSLFGTSPPNGNGTASQYLFDDDAATSPKPKLRIRSPPVAGPSSSLFAGGDDDDDYDDEDPSGSSHWSMPPPRQSRSRADVIRTLLAADELPESYLEAFDAALHDDPVGPGGSRAGAGAVAKMFAAARVHPDQQAHIMNVMAADSGDEVALDRSEFGVLLALVGLTQEGEAVSLDGVDERRQSLPVPKLAGLTAEPVLPPITELGANPPQTLTAQSPQSPPKGRVLSRAPPTTMDYPDTEADPWGRPDLVSPPDHHIKDNGSHQHDSPDSHDHAPLSHSGSTAYEAPAYEAPAYEAPAYEAPTFEAPAPASPQSHDRTGSSSFTMPSQPSSASPPRQNSNPAPGWSYFDGRQGSAGFGETPIQPTPQPTGLFGSPLAYNNPQPTAQHARGPSLATNNTAGSRATGRANHAGEEHVVVALMPEKEGIFLFQHHNYEVTSPRRNSKVIRRYSDFVWLLDCLHKRYPFRILPLLPPKRVAVNGNHLSNDGAFIEKRRRGLGRFLKAVVRHPVLSQEQLVVMFLTVPTELSVWRKQATISVQDEFAGRALPPGLQESLPNELEELFDRTRFAVTRSAELYITVCNTVDRLVKRSEGVAADHGRLALSLSSLVDATQETYATDTSDVGQINAGITSTGKHIRTAQNLMEDESRAWEVGVLEDLKRQRDTLVSVRDMFDRRDRLDRDNIPTLERRIESNEAKLQALRAKPEGAAKPGEVEKVVEAIIKDKESIVQQHNRSVFVRECIRDELLHFQTSQYHITRWNQEWAQERVKYTEMLADNWRRLLDDLERMPLGR